MANIEPIIKKITVNASISKVWKAILTFGKQFMSDGDYDTILYENYDRLNNIIQLNGKSYHLNEITAPKDEGK